MREKLINQVKSEIAFLTGKNMKWLVHEADIGTCHDNYLPIIHRVSKLRKKLKSLSTRSSGKSQDEDEPRGASQTSGG